MLTQDGIAFSFHDIVRIEVGANEQNARRRGRGTYGSFTTRKIRLIDHDDKSIEITCFSDDNSIPVFVEDAATEKPPVEG